MGRRRLAFARSALVAVVIGWVVSAALAGCGSTPAGSAGPGFTALDGGSSGPPTTLPFVQPPTPEFTKRAEHIASALRSSGALARYANGLVLLSDRVTWPDIGADGDLKMALADGAYDAGPGVSDEPATSPITFDDGSTTQVSLLGARTTLAEAKRGLRGCVRAEKPCPLVMTSARLGTTVVWTNRGQVQLPVWEYSADGFVTPMVIVAVDPDELLGLPEPVYTEPSWGSLLGVEALESVEGSTLHLMLQFGACERDRAAHAYEADDIVVVGGSSVQLPGGCPAIGYAAPASVVLSKPLGDRLLVNVTWGAPVLPRTS